MQRLTMGFQAARIGDANALDRCGELIVGDACQSQGLIAADTPEERAPDPFTLGVTELAKGITEQSSGAQTVYLA